MAKPRAKKSRRFCNVSRGFWPRNTLRLICFASALTCQRMYFFLDDLHHDGFDHSYMSFDSSATLYRQPGGYWSTWVTQQTRVNRVNLFYDDSEFTCANPCELSAVTDACVALHCRFHQSLSLSRYRTNCLDYFFLQIFVWRGSCNQKAHSVEQTCLVCSADACLCVRSSHRHACNKACALLHRIYCICDVFILNSSLVFVIIHLVAIATRSKTWKTCTLRTHCFTDNWIIKSNRW